MRRSKHSHFVRLTICDLYVVWITLACCVGVGRAVADSAKTGKGFNVLFLMTDEQHHRSLSLTGNRYVTTPNMDRIGAKGRCS